MNNPENKCLDDDLLDFLADFQRFEQDYENCKEQCEQLKVKLQRVEDEVKAARDMERSHRYNLTTSTKIIADLQSNLSHFVGLKSEVKTMSEDNKHKDNIILDKEQEIAELKVKQNEEIVNVKKNYEQKMEQVRLEYESKISNFENEMDTKVALATCKVGELNNKIKVIETDSAERVNMIVLDYEEKLLKAHAQIRQFRDEHFAMVARSNTNIEVYQKRNADQEEKIRELEGKIKESQIKQCDIGIYQTNNCQAPKYKTYTEPIETNTFQQNSEKDCSNKTKQTAKNTNIFTPLTIIRKESVCNTNNKDENVSENRFIAKKRKLFNNTVEGNF